MNRNKIEEKAVRVVADYIDDHCPKLKSFCQANDKTPIWDGEIHIYRSKDHKVANFMARVPLQIKGTTNTNDDFYRIEREYLEAYLGDSGCVFFMVQEDKDSYKPQRILYAMLSMEDVNAKLQRNTQTIKIGLKEVPADPLDFQEELVKFANQRRGGPIENPAPKEIAALVKRFRDIEQHLDEVSDRGVKIELRSFLDTIKSLKNDGTVGWRDTFVYLSRKVLELTLQHINGYDALDLELELANYLYKQRLYHLTEDYYLHALAVCRERAKANPDAYLPYVARTLNNLGILYRKLNQFESAEADYKEALDIRRKLAQANPDACLADVARTLNNLGVLHMNLNHFEAAEADYKEALDIHRKLAVANPDAYLPDVAMTLNNLGVLHRNLNQFESAEADYKEALDIRRKLAQATPDAYLPNVARTLNNLGVLHKNLNQFESAEADYKEALDIHRKLAVANPDAYLPDVAMTLNNLGILHRNLKQFKAAEADYKEALDIYRKLAQATPDAYLPNVARTLNNLGVLHKNLNHFEAAEADYKEALDIHRKLAQANPDAYLPNVARTLYNIALLMMKDDQRKEESKQACQEALYIYKVMGKKASLRFYKYVDMAQRLFDKISKL